jgi:hypothetical protein
MAEWLLMQEAAEAEAALLADHDAYTREAEFAAPPFTFSDNSSDDDVAHV